MSDRVAPSAIHLTIPNCDGVMASVEAVEARLDRTTPPTSDRRGDGLSRT